MLARASDKAIGGLGAHPLYALHPRRCGDPCTQIVTIVWQPFTAIILPDRFCVFLGKTFVTRLVVVSLQHLILNRSTHALGTMFGCPIEKRRGWCMPRTRIVVPPGLLILPRQTNTIFTTRLVDKPLHRFHIVTCCQPLQCLFFQSTPQHAFDMFLVRTTFHV